MTAPTKTAEGHARQAPAGRGRSIAAAIGYAPFLLLYVLVHTKYLRAWLPESKGAQVGVLIGLPALWFGFVMLLYRYFSRRGLRDSR
jgi:hypothetical protein